MKIDWDEFKNYKNEMTHLKEDKLLRLVYFLKSLYNLKNLQDIYKILQEDDLASMMLQKRAIDSPKKLQEYLTNL